MNSNSSFPIPLLQVNNNNNNKLLHLLPLLRLLNSHNLRTEEGSVEEPRNEPLPLQRRMLVLQRRNERRLERNLESEE